MCKCKRPSSVDEHVDHLFNCKLFTAEVIVDMTQLSIHEVHSLYIYLNTLHNRFLFQDMVICELPLDIMEELLIVLSGD